MTGHRYYNFIHKSPLGQMKNVDLIALTADWTLKLNSAYTLTITVPNRYYSQNRQGYLFSDFVEDDRIEIWRQIFPGGVKKLVGETPFFVTRVESDRDETGKHVLNIEAEGGIALFSRRICPQDSVDGDSIFTGQPTDNSAKRVIRNQYGAGAGSYISDPDPLRVSTAWITIAADTGAVPTAFEGNISNQSLTSALQGMSTYAHSQGQPMFIDVVQTDNAIGASPFLEFRTYAGQRGTDRRLGSNPNPVVLLPEVNIGAYQLILDFTKNYNRVYVGAKQGTGNTRNYITVPPLLSTEHTNLQTRIAAAPFALRELFLGSTSDVVAEMTQQGWIELKANQQVFSASGTVVDSLNFLYARDLDFGDKTTAIIEGISMDVHIQTEVGHLESNRETLEINFTTEPAALPSGGGTLGEIISHLSTVDKKVENLNRIER